MASDKTEAIAKGVEPESARGPRRLWTTVFRRLRAIDPTSLRCRKLGAKAGDLIAHGRYADADVALAKGLAMRPHDPTLLYRYALSANDSGRPETALERWRAARAASPDNPMCLCGIAAAQRMMNLIDDAKTTIDEAAALFPCDPTVASEAARIAILRYDDEGALACWDRALSGAVHPDWLFGRAHALVKLHRFDEADIALARLRDAAPDHAGFRPLAQLLQRERANEMEPDDRRIPFPEPAVNDAWSIATNDLAARFESLGDNCEVGLLQRYCDIEPLGLFRFSFSRITSLVDLMDNDFACYGDDGDLTFSFEEGNEEYNCSSRHYKDFNYHTEMLASEIEHDTLLKRETKKVRYLKRRLVEDMASGEKIFVRKGGEIAGALTLFKIMRRYGPVNFLFVGACDGDHPSGHVECVEPGFYCGHIERFAPYGNAHDIDMASWGELLCNTLNLVSGTRYRPRSNVVYRTGWTWNFGDRCESALVDQPRFPGAPVRRLRLVGDTKRMDAIVADRLIDRALPAGGQFTLSLWVYIPADFRGSFVDVYFLNAPGHYVSCIDLDRRDTWQRVWASSTLPKDQTHAVVAMRITAFDGDALYIGPWMLESGCVPNHWTPADSATDANADHTVC